jgi:hypothetical protein
MFIYENSHKPAQMPAPDEGELLKADRAAALIGRQRPLDVSTCQGTAVYETPLTQGIEVQQGWPDEVERFEEELTNPGLPKTGGLVPTDARF